MIITRTPLRISFVGGGSDIASFYKTEPGAVISTTINKYVYITVNKRFDGKFRLSYTDTEIVDNVDDFKHLLGRETLKYFKLKEGIEVHSIGDIPAQTGLANSGAYTVGLIHAMLKYTGEKITPKKLADLATLIEIEKAQRPIGKQDQYVQAFGGLNYIQFNPDESVIVEPINLSTRKLKEIQSNMILFYTGKTGSSAKVLSMQTKKMADQANKRTIMSQMVELTREFKKQLQKGNINSFGEMLHENWLLKKQMSSGISNSEIDEWYNTAMKKGAMGGKICGAGGRGFLLFYAPNSYHKKIIKALSNLQLVDFSFEPKGSMIVYNQ